MLKEATGKEAYPTAKSFVKPNKDLYNSAYNQISKDQISYNLQEQTRSLQNSAKIYKHQVEAHPAGYSNFGP